MENLGARRRSALLWFILSPKKNCTSLGAGQCDLRDMLEFGSKKMNPANESERLAALRSYEILDTEPEKSFDDLTSLASHVCETPIALISLVDSDRQWFKSRVGLDIAETARDISFCTHAIQQNQLFMVNDAAHDERFALSELVTEEPRIRFYAAAPI